MFTTINPDVYLSSHEIRLAAKFQEQHKTMHPSGYNVTKFITVVLKPQEDGSCLPEAYMVSDTVQALERDNVLGDSERRRRVVVREIKDKKELLPQIMKEGKPVTEFEPE